MDSAAFRYGAIVLILIALGGGVWTRRHFAAAGGPAPPGETGDGPAQAELKMAGSGLKAAGSFQEPMTGLDGFELDSPGCSGLLGILPVPASHSEITPAAFGYRPGAFDVSYMYNGRVYPEQGISYRLKLLDMLYRGEFFLGLVRKEQIAFYLKIWRPSGCPPLTATEAAALEQAVIAARAPGANAAGN